MGSDCHRGGGCAAHPHLLLLHHQKMLLQEEKEQEREERQGWFQHEEHAGRRGMMPCAERSEEADVLMLCLSATRTFSDRIMSL